MRDFGKLKKLTRYYLILELVSEKYHYTSLFAQYIIKKITDANRHVVTKCISGYARHTLEIRSIELVVANAGAAIDAVANFPSKTGYSVGLSSFRVNALCSHWYDKVTLLRIREIYFARV